ncbi:ABC transporter substrate-binding protein [Paenibacillus endoradicis]|uniref:ABC transporter substrate-binding protein n=1 Tax=Paenibacillus endoradicis TaxID=2972487 RepID=UPI0021590D60|nr:ABC transporter substrate-binding protein [Paenibacillus endoradicis]MCR8655960.1 ABC transporter substrate-binding protein [Paenibacillus endoradicis]MCR8658286.1 ABC transporter substrate-binding protein [Paenibacillus endoradicis]
MKSLELASKKGSTFSMIIALVLVLSMVLTGCGSNTGQSGVSNNSTNKETSSPNDTTTNSNEPIKDGTIIVALSTDISTLDPSREGGWETYLVNKNVHESLVKEDLTKSSEESPTAPIIPGLAESWDISEDGRTYTFHLRQGVKFQDGADFNAEAVEFNVRRAWDKSFEYFDEASSIMMSRTYHDLKEVKSIDTNTVSLTFNNPYPALLRLLAQGSGGSGLIASPEAIKTYGNDGYGEHPSGTGPYQLEERVIGEKIVLTRNEGYWGEQPYNKKIIFRPISDNNARVAALRTGEVDIIQNPPVDSLAQLEAEGFLVPQADLPIVYYLTLNTANEYLQDVKVRQAITLAIDRESLAKDLLNGYAIPAYSAVNAGSEIYDPQYKPFQYDVEKAKQLLTEAGYPDGLELTLQTYLGTESYVEWIQRDLEKVGVKVKIETYDYNTFGSLRFMSPDVGINTMDWGFVTPYWLYIVGYSSSTGRYGNYASANFDKAVDLAMNEVDYDQSLEYWKQARDVIDEDAAIVPLFSNRTLVAVSSKVKGFVLPSQNWYDLETVWLEE